MTTNTQTRAAITTANEARLLRTQLDTLTVKNATLAAENRRLRRMTTNGRMGRILHRTAADARQIVGWRFANYSVSRRNCESYGMTQQRWAWGMALLRAAGIVPYPGDSDAFTVESLDEALAMIDSEVKRIAARGDLSRLALRMYRRRRR
jgi:hypothetical protein